MILVGYGKGISKKTNKPYFKVVVIKDASAIAINNGQIGRIASSEFVGEEVFKTLNPKMLDKNIEFDYYIDGRFVQIVGIHLV